MRPEDLQEVLQWMHLAMGTAGNLVFTDQSPLDLGSMMDKLQQLKADADFNKNEADRYKRELESVNAELSVKSRECSRLSNELEASKRVLDDAMSEFAECGRELELARAANEMGTLLLEDLEGYREETDRCKEELEAVNAELKVKSDECSLLSNELEASRRETEKIQAGKDESTTAFKDVITRNNEKIREVEMDLEKVRVESTLYKMQLMKQMAEESKGVVAVQEKIDEIKEMLEASGVGIVNLSSLGGKVTETTIRARFKRISQLDEDCVYSPYTEVAGVNWKIHLCKRSGYLSFCLIGDKEGAARWSCSVFTEYQLISQDSESSIYRKGKGTSVDVYTHNDENWGYSKFISFKDLFDKEEGYVKDDSIIVTVTIKAFPAQ